MMPFLRAVSGHHSASDVSRPVEILVYASAARGTECQRLNDSDNSEHLTGTSIPPSFDSGRRYKLGKSDNRRPPFQRFRVDE